VKRKFASLNKADELTPLQKQAYSYAKERFGFEDAKNSLDQIKTLTTKEEFSDWVQKKIEAEKGLNEGVWSVLPARIPEFIAKVEELKDEYHGVVGSDDVYDGLDMAIRAAKELMNLKEAEGDTEKDTAETDVTDVTVDDTETIDTETTAEVDPNVKAVQDALTQAQAAAQKLGDKKLTDQIGNTITFFTRAHVVDKGAVAEVEGLTEGKYKKGDMLQTYGGEEEVTVIDIKSNLAAALADTENPKAVRLLKQNLRQNLIDDEDKNKPFYLVTSNSFPEDMYYVESELKSSINESMFPMLKKILK